MRDLTAAPGAPLRAVARDRDEEDLAWQERALCAQADPEVFFPDLGAPADEALRVCRRCEVRADCLGYALEHNERYGVWGGLAEEERRGLTRHRAPAVPGDHRGSGAGPGAPVTAGTARSPR